MDERFPQGPPMAPLVLIKRLGTRLAVVVMTKVTNLLLEWLETIPKLIDLTLSWLVSASRCTAAPLVVGLLTN